MKRGGFTLIEILIYTAIVVLITATFIPAAYQIVDSRGRIQRQLELIENKKFLIEKIKWALQSNQAINSPAKGASGSTLSLNKLNFGTNPLVFDSLNNKARLTSGGGGPVPITNSWADIVNLTFTHQDLSGKSAIKIQGTVQNVIGSLLIDTTIQVN